MKTLFNGKYYTAVYNDLDFDVSSCTHLDLSEVTNYFVVNNSTGKVEGTAIAASQAKKLVELLDSLEDGTDVPQNNGPSEHSGLISRH